VIATAQRCSTDGIAMVPTWSLTFAAHRTPTKQLAAPLSFSVKRPCSFASPSIAAGEAKQSPTGLAAELDDGPGPGGVDVIRRLLRHWIALTLYSTLRSWNDTIGTRGARQRTYFDIVPTLSVIFTSRYESVADIAAIVDIIGNQRGVHVQCTLTPPRVGLWGLVCSGILPAAREINGLFPP